MPCEVARLPRFRVEGKHRSCVVTFPRGFGERSRSRSVKRLCSFLCHWITTKHRRCHSAYEQGPATASESILYFLGYGRC